MCTARASERCLSLHAIVLLSHFYFMTSEFENVDFDDDFDDDANVEDNESSLHENFAQLNSDAILNSAVSLQKTYCIRQGGAVNESEKEFEIFKFWLSCGSGRSTTYIATTFNLQLNKVNAIAKKNYWAERTSDYDIDTLHEKLKLEQDSRAIEHKQRLESYRLQQEFLGRNLSANAAKLTALSQRTLDEYLENNRAVDIRDIPGILNTAAKIAEVGKNLQSGALGVEQLLVALEEADFDE